MPADLDDDDFSRCRSVLPSLACNQMIPSVGGHLDTTSLGFFLGSQIPGSADRLMVSQSQPPRLFSLSVDDRVQLPQFPPVNRALLFSKRRFTWHLSRAHQAPGSLLVCSPKELSQTSSLRVRMPHIQSPAHLGSLLTGLPHKGLLLAWRRLGTGVVPGQHPIIQFSSRAALE